jgi:hypothetical protein
MCIRLSTTATLSTGHERESVAAAAGAELAAAVAAHTRPRVEKIAVRFIGRLL